MLVIGDAPFSGCSCWEIRGRESWRARAQYTPASPAGSPSKRAPEAELGETFKCWSSAKLLKKGELWTRGQAAADGAKQGAGLD